MYDIDDYPRYEYDGDVLGTADFALSYSSSEAVYGPLDYGIINAPMRRFKYLLHGADDQWIRGMRQVCVIPACVKAASSGLACS